MEIRPAGPSVVGGVADPAGFGLMEGVAPSTPVARCVHQNGRAWWFVERPPGVDGATASNGTRSTGVISGLLNSRGLSEAAYNGQLQRPPSDAVRLVREEGCLGSRRGPARKKMVNPPRNYSPWCRCNLRHRFPSSSSMTPATSIQVQQSHRNAWRTETSRGQSTTLLPVTSDCSANTTKLARFMTDYVRPALGS